MEVKKIPKIIKKMTAPKKQERACYLKKRVWLLSIQTTLATPASLALQFGAFHSASVAEPCQCFP